jgi:hypothetical protein
MESSFESRVRARLTRLLIVAYRAFADRSRLLVREARRADEKQGLALAGRQLRERHTKFLEFHPAVLLGRGFKLSTTGGVFDFAASLAEFRWEHLYACRRMHL